jgi:hypothetical protein
MILTPDRLAMMLSWWKVIAAKLAERDMAGTVCSAHLRHACLDIEALHARVRELEITIAVWTELKGDFDGPALLQRAVRAEERVRELEAGRLGPDKAAALLERWSGRFDCSPSYFDELVELIARELERPHDAVHGGTR